MNQTYNFIKDIKPLGILNIIIIIFLTIYFDIYLRRTGYFRGWKRYHYSMWYPIYVIHIFYLLYIIKDINEIQDDRLSLSVYQLITEGGYKPLEDIIYESDKTTNTIIGLIYFIVIFFMPIPSNKKISLNDKILLILSRIGIVHLMVTFLDISFKL